MKTLFPGTVVTKKKITYVAVIKLKWVFQCFFFHIQLPLYNARLNYFSKFSCIFFWWLSRYYPLNLWMQITQNGNNSPSIVIYLPSSCCMWWLKVSFYLINSCKPKLRFSWFLFTFYFHNICFLAHIPIHTALESSYDKDFFSCHKIRLN